jgi:hypothetical protein
MAQGLDSVTIEYIRRINVISGIHGSPVLDGVAIKSVDNFVKGCRADGIWDKLIEVNGFINVTGSGKGRIALTPIILGAQGGVTDTYSWNPIGFGDGDVSVNGVQGNGANYMQTNMDPTGTFPGRNDVGISMYVSTITASANTIDVGAFSSANDSCLLLYANSFNQTAAGCWDPGGSDGPTSGAGAQPNLNGFYSFSRTASNVAKLYFANSTNAFAQLGSTNTGTPAATIFSTRKLVVFACTANSGTIFDFSDRKLSFMAFHKGLTSTETNFLYNRVQQFRTDLGGGFT